MLPQLYLHNFFTKLATASSIVRAQTEKVSKFLVMLINVQELCKLEAGFLRLFPSCCAWYLRKEVEEEMQRHTPPPLAHQDDLSLKTGYLQRILDYAFGAQGDIWVLGQRLDQTEVKKFNKEEEIIA